MEKKICLIQPFIPRTEAYASPVGEIIDGEHVPLGIYYIAAYLRKCGYETKVIDALALKLADEDIFSCINDFSPSFIGIGATTVAFPRAAALAHAVKNRFPRLVTIIGGRHVTSDFEHAMSFNAFDFGKEFLSAGPASPGSTASIMSS